MLFWVYTCQNATLLEITCRDSYISVVLAHNDSFSANVGKGGIIEKTVTIL